MQPPTILLVGDTLRVGGTEGQLTEIATRLDRRRWTVDVACLAAEGPLRPRLEAAGLRPWSFGRGSLRPRSWAASVVTLARHVRSRRVAVVHAFDFYSNVVAVPAGRLVGVAVLASQRDLGDLRRPRDQRLHRLMLRRASTVLVNSPAVATALLRSGAVKPWKVVVVPNGVDLERFRPVARRVGRAPVVGALANLRPEKGLDHLVRAAPLLRDRIADVRVVIWGEGPQRRELERLSAALGVESTVALRGHTARPEEALGELDVFVLPSLSEASPNAVLEAMAMRVPVVASDVGGVPALVQNEVHGLLVPPGDPFAIAKAVLGLLDEPDRAAALAASARARVRREFGFERTVARLDTVYAALVARRRR